MIKVFVLVLTFTFGDSAVNIQPPFNNKTDCNVEALRLRQERLVTNAFCVEVIP